MILLNFIAGSEERLLVRVIFCLPDPVLRQEKAHPSCSCLRARGRHSPQGSVHLSPGRVLDTTTVRAHFVNLSNPLGQRSTPGRSLNLNVKGNTRDYTHVNHFLSTRHHAKYFSCLILCNFQSTLRGRVQKVIESMN